MTIKVLIVDDHELVRTGISRMLGDDPEIEVVGEAGCGGGAPGRARKHARGGGSHAAYKTNGGM